VSRVRRGELGGWRSRTTFLLALSASAVGLGNLWRFSYLAGEHGGGLFVLTYLLCLFLVAVPVMVAEVVIGSHGRGGAVEAIRWATDRSLRSRGWLLLGWLACLTGLLILSYYVVVAGWAVAYAWYMQSGLFAAASVDIVAEQFGLLLVDPLQMIYWQSLFLGVALLVLALGIRRGLGMLVWLSVPALMVVLGMLVRFALETGDLAATREFLFTMNPVDFSPRSVLVALGQALYTLGLGVGVGINYGAYAPRRTPIGRSVIAVAVFDTAIALLAGVAIFPVVFANNLEPSMGPGLMFVSLPCAFGNIVQGDLFGTLFFALVVIAALGSVVAMLECLVAVLIQGLRIGRFTAVVLVGALVWLLAMLVAGSFDPGANLLPFANGELFGLLDTVTADVLLPLVALLTAIFVGWRLRSEILRRALYRELDLFYSLWRCLLRYIAPPAIVIIIVARLFGAQA
jgi:NSS family neurotransmitter:Na+ symporter